MRLLAALVIIFASVGVSAGDPYRELYKANPYLPQQGVSALPGYEAPVGEPELFVTTAPVEDRALFYKRGYWDIGLVEFNAANGDIYERKLRKQAKRVGAHAILLYSKYSHTLTGTSVVKVPSQAMTRSHGSASVNGSVGSATATGSSTSYTQSSETLVVPTTQDRADVSAMFLVKLKQDVGLMLSPLSEDTRRQRQSNQGQLVTLVVEDTPAFRANVMEGEILLAIGDVPIFGKPDWDQATNKFRGTSPEFVFVRDGEEVRRKIPILNW